MHLRLFATILCSALCYYGATASMHAAPEDDDFFDVDAILQNEKFRANRIERSPDYGAGLGGPLAAVTLVTQPKPTPRPAPTPAPTQKPTQKPSDKPTNKPTQKPSPGPSPAPTPAPTKKPDQPKKDQKGGSCSANGRSGEDIANELYNHPNECKDPKNGGIWAPLPNGQACGKDGNCNFPKQWCSAKSEGNSGNSPNLSCQDLSPECQQAVCGESTTTGAPQPSTETATTGAPSPSPSSQASNPASSRATPPPTRQTTAASGSTTSSSSSKPSGDCQDKHPYCCFWADNSNRQSECDKNAKWMKAMCQKSCGTCGCKDSSCPTKVNTDGCQWLPGKGGQGRLTRVVLSNGPGPFSQGGFGQSFPGQGQGVSGQGFPGQGQGIPGQGFPGQGVPGAGNSGAPKPGLTRIFVG